MLGDGAFDRGRSSGQYHDFARGDLKGEPGALLGHRDGRHQGQALIDSGEKCLQRGCSGAHRLGGFAEGLEPHAGQGPIGFAGHQPAVELPSERCQFRAQERCLAVQSERSECLEAFGLG